MLLGFGFFMLNLNPQPASEKQRGPLRKLLIILTKASIIIILQLSNSET